MAGFAPACWEETRIWNWGRHRGHCGEKWGSKARKMFFVLSLKKDFTLVSWYRGTLAEQFSSGQRLCDRAIAWAFSSCFTPRAYSSSFPLLLLPPWY